MSATYALSLSPPRPFLRDHIRTISIRTSITLSKSKYGADYINDGVQGANPVFYNTFPMFDKFGSKASPVGMQVGFGPDADADFWSNVSPSRVVDRFRSDIQKFGRVLKVIVACLPSSPSMRR